MKNLIEALEKSTALKPIGFIALGIILVWSLIGVDFSHAHTWAEQNIPLFWSIFTIVAAVVLIFVAGWVAHIIQISEDYYDR